MNAPEPAAPSAVAAGLVEQARRTPDRIAVTDAETSLTFAELDASAGSLAAVLGERLGGDPTPIPVFVGRDRWSVVAVHAAFRAGVPFVPLARDDPPAVLRGIVDRLGRPPLVVTTGSSADLGPIGVDAVAAEHRLGHAVAPRPIEHTALASVIFTSGSSGRPKGVMLDRAAWDARLADLAGEIRLPDGSPATSGVALPLQWTGGLGRVAAIAAGLSVVLPARPFTDPEEFVRWLEAVGATHTNLVPSLFSGSVRPWTGPRAEGLRSVWTGGEGAGWELIEVLRAVAPSATIGVAYGASETAGTACVLEVGPTDPVGSGPLPVGRPVGSGRVRFETASGGADGADGSDSVYEIVVTGAIAHGYWDDPAETARRFGNDPDGTRWWRSGDLVRFDGPERTMLVGRVDDVVKISGRLVAPAEAERLLESIPDVAGAAVVPDFTGARPRLVGHLVIHEGSPISPTDVRERCRAALAPGVVPTVLVRHAELPRTPSGKVDRARLAAAPVRPWRAEPGRGARPGREAALTAELRRISGIDDLGPDDDLLIAGLDSLGVVELSDAAGMILGTPVDVGELLRAGTVADLCDGSDGGRRSSTVVFHPSGRRPPVFLVPPGGAGAWRFRALGAALGADRPLAVIEPRGLHGPGRPHRSFRAQVAHAVSEIVGRNDPGRTTVVVGYSGSAPLAYAVGVRLWHRRVPVHVVLLDSAPIQSANYAVAADRAAREGRPPPTDVERPGRPTLRNAVVRARRRLWARWHSRRRSGRVAVGDLETRRRAFATLTALAARRYRPPAATFPVTEVRVEFGEIIDTALRAVAPSATTVEVSGNHLSMLDPPHVAEVAAVIATVTDDPTQPVR